MCDITHVQKGQFPHTDLQEGPRLSLHTEYWSKQKVSKVQVTEHTNSSNVCHKRWQMKAGSFQAGLRNSLTTAKVMDVVWRQLPCFPDSGQGEYGSPWETTEGQLHIPLYPPLPSCSWVQWEKYDLPLEQSRIQALSTNLHHHYEVLN